MAVFRHRPQELLAAAAGLLLVFPLGAGGLYAALRGPDLLGAALAAALVLYVVWAVLRLRAVRVRGDGEGLEVVDLRGTTRVAWPDVVAIEVGEEDPLRVLVRRRDGEPVEVEALQGRLLRHTRGQRAHARRAVQRLEALRP